MLVEEGKSGASSSVNESAHISRNWVALTRDGFHGKFVPDNEVPDFENSLSQKGRIDYESWLRETTSVVIETEMNVQLGEFTIKKHVIAPLDPSIMHDPAFFNIFSGMAPEDVIQCAEVMHTTERMWVRLIGMGFDVQSWTPDTRVPLFNAKITFKKCVTSWATELLSKWMGAAIFDGIELFCDVADCSNADAVIFYGYAISEIFSDSVSGGQSVSRTVKTLKEVIVYKAPRVFHVFNVFSHGRQFFRSQIFSSDPLYSLYDLPLNDGAYSGSTFLQSSGNISIPEKPSTSLIVTHALQGDDDADEETKEKDKIINGALVDKANRLFQEYVPWYALRGLLPGALLSQYMFWQNPDNTLTGYMSQATSLVTKSVIFIKIVQDKKTVDFSGNGNSIATAFISRVNILENETVMAKKTRKGGNPSYTAMFDYMIDTSVPQLYLINLLEIIRQCDSTLMKDPDTIRNLATLKDFVQLLHRLDSFSNILVWSKSNPETSGNIQIDIIELPRLHITFEKRLAHDGTYKYFCVEHSGMFLSTTIDIKHKHLITDLPHAILLSNSETEYFVLLPATAKPTITKVSGDKFSYKLTLNRMDEDWVRDTGETGCFVYPVHSSGGFLSSKSFASTLYLLLFRVLMRKYNDAFRLVETCVCDTMLTAQERQFYTAFGEIRDTLFPEAHAMRLKLFFVTYGFSHVMHFPFDYRAEMLNYLTRLTCISSQCRLTHEEEAFILARIEEKGIEDENTWIFKNRKSLIQGSFNLFLESFSPKAENNCFAMSYPVLSSQNVNGSNMLIDEPVNLEVLDTSKPQFKAWISKFSVLKYQKPEGNMIGISAINFLMHMLLGEGIDLKGKNSLGFFFLYELMNNTLQIRILAEDTNHNIGSILLRILTDDAISALPQSYALLRIMAEHPNLAILMPPFEDKRMLRLPSISGLDIFQSHVKNVATFIKTNSSILQLEKLGFGIPQRYKPPVRINGSSTPDQDVEKFSVGRVWISPRVTDFNCSSRTFSVELPSLFTNRFSQIITSNDLDAFGTVPLKVIGLDDFIEYKSLADRKIPSVSSNSPLEVMQHPFSRSHIARTSVARLEEDIHNFANDENISLVPILKSIYNTDMDSKSADDIEGSIRFINRLNIELNKLKSRDMAFTDGGIEEIVSCTNGDGSVGARRVNSRAILHHKLMQMSGVESVLVI